MWTEKSLEEPQDLNELKLSYKELPFILMVVLIQELPEEGSWRCRPHRYIWPALLAAELRVLLLAGEYTCTVSPQYTKPVFQVSDTGLTRQHLASSTSPGLTSDLETLDPVSRLLRHYQDHHLMSALDTLVWPTHEAPVTSVMPTLDLVTR